MFLCKIFINVVLIFWCNEWVIILYFSFHGSISRRICTDRFEDIDIFLYGEGYQSTGSFRRGFFLFLFVTVYLLPLVIIMSTCARIVISLLQTPAHLIDDRRHQNNQRREENRRKVRQYA